MTTVRAGAGAADRSGSLAIKTVPNPNQTSRKAEKRVLMTDVSEGVKAAAVPACLAIETEHNLNKHSRNSWVRSS